MRKHVFVAILLLGISLVFVAASETTVSHYLPELEISVDIPVEITCVSRESDETNTFFQSEYFDYSEVHQYMLDNSFYLYGMTIDLMGEFALIATDYDDEDFNTLDFVFLNVYAYQLQDALSSQGATNIEYDIYKGEKNKAIRVHYTYKMQQADQYVLCYYTTHESKLIIFRFISFYSKITDQQEKMIQSIFDSLEWGKKPYSTEPKGNTDTNIYSDNETGLSFMVPSGWSEVNFVAGDNSKKIKYRIGTDNVWVLYESDDMWDVFVDAYGDLFETYGITRKDVDNEFLSKELIAKQLGCSESDVTMKTIEGQEFYCMNRVNTYSAGDISLDTQDLVYICIRDSYMYWFQMSGTGIAKYEDQFNRFMRTIEFP